jgi:hypothetical protein
VKIAIATDSRGDVGWPPWTAMFVSDHPQHQCFASLPVSTSFTTIFDHTPRLISAGKFDIGIVQLGYHEYVVPWNMGYWDAIVKDFDPNYRDHVTLCPDFDLGGGFRPFRKTYHYRHDETVADVFRQLRTCCDRLLFVGMPFSWKEFEAKTIMMNEVYSSLCDAAIQLPMDPEFPVFNTLFNGVDRVHYTQDYARQLAIMVGETVKCLI